MKDEEVFYDDRGRELRPDENPEYWNYANGKHGYLGSHQSKVDKTNEKQANTKTSPRRNTHSNVSPNAQIVVGIVMLLLGIGVFYLIYQVFFAWIFQ